MRILGHLYEERLCGGKKKVLGPSWVANVQSGKRQNPKSSQGLDCETLKGRAKEMYSEEDNGSYF